MDEATDHPPEQQEAIPRGQVLYDRIFLWLILSLLLSGIMYNAWGIYQLLTLQGG